MKVTKMNGPTCVCKAHQNLLSAYLCFPLAQHILGVPQPAFDGSFTAASDPGRRYAWPHEAASGLPDISENAAGIQRGTFRSVTTFACCKKRSCAREFTESRKEKGGSKRLPTLVSSVASLRAEAPS